MPTATPFNNLITFSRGSNATVTGSNGLIQWAPNNLLTFSEQFDNAAAWPKTNATVTANAAIAPDGSSTADLMYPTTTGTNRRILRSTTLTVGTAYAQSVYVKAAGKQWVYLNGIDASGPDNNCWFDLQNGVIGTKGASVLSAGITAVGNGWYRIFTVALAGANNYFYLMGVDGDNTITSTTNGTDGILIWGAQLELGSTATTYNSTTVKNLLGFSEAFDNAAWTKSNSSIVTGAQANPVNGLFNAQKLMEDTSTGLHFVAQAATTAAAPHTFSCYAKAAGRNFIFLYNPATNISLSVDLTTGATGQASGTAAPTASSAVNVGSGWYRVSMTLTTTAASNNFRVYLGQSLTGTGSYTGDGNSGVYIYGAQLSDSASLDAYVPTPAAAPSSTAYYGPRFDYDPVTLAPKGLLVEEARTNLFRYSEDLTNVAWVKTDTSVTTNSTTAPDGTATADTLTALTTGLFRYAYQSVTLTNGLTYTISAYFKYKTAQWVWLLGQTGADAFALFDVLNGVVGVTSANVTSTIANAGNGWFKATATFTVSSATAAEQVGFGVSDTNVAVNMPATAGLDTFVWGAQLEAGAFATSYIPTVASTVTRSADVATINGSLFSQWYGQSEGTFVLEMSQVALGEFCRFLEATDITFNTRKPLLLMNSSNQYVMQFRDNGVDQASPVVGIMSANMVMKLSAAYRTNDFAGTLNGGTPATDTSGVVTTAVDRFFIGSGGSSPTDQISCHIRSIDYIPTRIADFQLQALTELPLVPTLDLDFLNNLYEA